MLFFHSSSKSTAWYHQDKAPVLQAGPCKEITVSKPPLHLPQVISVGVTGKQKGALFGPYKHPLFPITCIPTHSGSPGICTGGTDFGHLTTFTAESCTFSLQWKKKE